MSTAIAPMLDIATRSDVLNENYRGPKPEWLRNLLGQEKGGYRFLHQSSGDALLRQVAGLDVDDQVIDRTDFGNGSADFVAALRAKNAARRAALENDLTDMGYAGP